MATDKKFNPNFGQGFGDDRFGDGSIVVQVTPEGLKALTENVQVGSRLVLRANKETKYGNMHYFTEIIPPFESNGKTTKTKGNGKTAAVTNELD